MCFDYHSLDTFCARGVTELSLSWIAEQQVFYGAVTLDSWQICAIRQIHGSIFAGGLERKPPGYDSPGHYCNCVEFCLLTNTALSL